MRFGEFSAQLFSAVTSNQMGVERADGRARGTTALLHERAPARVIASIERTNRLVDVQEAAPGGGWGETLVARVMERGFELLDAPPLIVAGDPTPIPYAGALEELWLPSSERIAAGIRQTIAF